MNNWTINFYTKLDNRNPPFFSIFPFSTNRARGARFINLEPELITQYDEERFLISLVKTPSIDPNSPIVRWDTYWVRIDQLGVATNEPRFFPRMAFQFKDDLQATYEEIADPSDELKSIDWAEWAYPTIGSGPIGLLRVKRGTKLDDPNLKSFIEPPTNDEWLLTKGRQLIAKQVKAAREVNNSTNGRFNRNDRRIDNFRQETERQSRRYRRSRSRSRSRSPARSTTTPPTFNQLSYGMPFNMYPPWWLNNVPK